MNIKADTISSQITSRVENAMLQKSYPKKSILLKDIEISSENLGLLLDYINLLFLTHAKKIAETPKGIEVEITEEEDLKFINTTVGTDNAIKIFEKYSEELGLILSLSKFHSIGFGKETNTVTLGGPTIISEIQMILTV